MRSPLPLLLVTLLLLGIGGVSPARAAGFSYGPIAAPSDASITAAGTMTVSGSSFELPLMLTTVNDGQWHCATIEVQWDGPLTAPDPVGSCGNMGGESGIISSGTPVPWNIRLRVCDAQMSGYQVVSTATCTPWLLLYRGTPNEAYVVPAHHVYRFGPVTARGAVASARGTLTTGARSTLKLALRPGARMHGCAWALVTGSRGGTWKLGTCGAPIRKRYVLGAVSGITVKVCAGRGQHILRATCRARRIGT